MLGLPAIEEAVRRARRRSRPRARPRRRQRLLEGGVVLRRDVRVLAGLQCEHGRLNPRRRLDRPGLAVALAGRAVEADGAREPVAARGGEPRLPPAEAEADREDALARPPSGERSQATAAAMSDWMVACSSGPRAPCTGSRRRACRRPRCGRTSRSRPRRSRARRSGARAPRRSGRDRARRAGRRCRRPRGRQASRRRPRSCVPSAEPRTRSSVRDRRAGDHGDGRQRVEFEAHARSLRRPTGVASPRWAICRSRRSRTCSAHGGASRPTCGRRRCTAMPRSASWSARTSGSSTRTICPSAPSRCAAASTSWPSSRRRSAPVA